MSHAHVLSMPARRTRALAVAVVVIATAGLLVSATRPSVASPPATLLSISPTSFDFGDVTDGTVAPNQQVTITNVSGAPIVMSGTGYSTGPFGGLQNCQGVTLDAGASCDIKYTFAPTSVGAQTDTATGNWNGQPFTFNFKGNGIRQFLVTPTSLDFGDVAVGTTSPSQQVAVTNVGTSSAVMSGTGGDGGVFGGTNNCTGSLAVGATCYMTYAFSPTTAGVQTGSATGSWEIGQSFNLSFTGNAYTGAAPGRLFTISPTGFDFGEVPVGAISPTQQVTITNVSGNTRLIAASIGTSTDAYFASQNCDGVMLAPGGSCSMQFDFSPTTVGSQPATATGSINGQALSFTLNGNGTRRFLISPTALDFGNVALGSSSNPQEVVLTNIGPAIIMDGTGGDGGDFGLVQNCQPSALGVGAKCEMAYTFTPTTAGLQTQAVSGTWNGQAYSLLLTGNAYQTSPPAITSLLPTSGPTGGGTLVAITGTHLGGATAIKFGTVSASAFTVFSDTMITVQAPPNAAGAQDITITTSGGTSSVVAADQFTYVASARPVVNHLAPTAGPVSGGNSVTLTGSGFTGATSVVFGGRAASSFTVVSNTTIVAVAPPQSAAAHHIYVITPGGTSAPYSTNLYTYRARPVVTHISPASGSHNGGTTVTITGTGFTGATAVFFSGTPATHVTVVSSTKITARSPAESAGVRNVLVFGPGGLTATVTADRFTYQ
jgi:hypothetical protein